MDILDESASKGKLGASIDHEVGDRGQIKLALLGFPAFYLESGHVDPGVNHLDVVVEDDDAAVKAGIYGKDHESHGRPVFLSTQPISAGVCSSQSVTCAL